MKFYLEMETHLSRKMQQRQSSTTITLQKGILTRAMLKTFQLLLQQPNRSLKRTLQPESSDLLQCSTQDHEMVTEEPQKQAGTLTNPVMLEEPSLSVLRIEVHPETPITGATISATIDRGITTTPIIPMAKQSSQRRIIQNLGSFGHKSAKMITIGLLEELLKNSNPHLCCLCLRNTDVDDGSMQLSEEVYLDVEDCSASMFYMIKCVLQQDDFLTTYVCNSCVISTINAYKFIVTSSQVTLKITKFIDGVTSDLEQGKTEIKKSHRIFISTDVNSVQTKLYYDTKDKSPYNKAHSKIQGLLSTFQAISNAESPLFKCVTCGHVCLNRAALNNHIKKNCEKTPCDICGILIFNRCLTQHKQACRKSQVKKTKNTGSIATHSSKRRICNKCGKKFRLLKSYKKHIHGSCKKSRTSDPLQIKPYKCKNCGSEYSAHSTLKLHMRIHSDNKNDYYECSWCQKRFAAPAQLASHAVKHTKEKKWTCETCGGKFVTRASLTYHIRTHTGETPYQCKFCEQSFLNASRRREHEKKRHLPKVQCKYCDKWYNQSHLAKHYRRHRAKNGKIQDNTQINSDSERPESSALRDQQSSKHKNGHNYCFMNDIIIT